MAESRYIAFIFLGIFSIFSANFAHAQNNTIIFGSPVNPGTPIFKSISEIYSEAFGQLGYEFHLISCEPINCRTLLGYGDIDGEPGRTKAWGQYVSNVIRVDQPVIMINFVAISTRDMPIEQFQDLRNNNYIIGYQRGYVIFEQKLKQVVPEKRVKEFIHWTEAIDALHRGEIDVYLTGNFNQQTIAAGREDLYFKTLDRSDSVYLYPYLIKKHGQLVDKLKSILESMHKSGRIRQILQENHLSGSNPYSAYPPRLH